MVGRRSKQEKQEKRPWKRLWIWEVLWQHSSEAHWACRVSCPDFFGGKNHLQRQPLVMGTGGSGTGISLSPVQHCIFSPIHFCLWKDSPSLSPHPRRIFFSLSNSRATSLFLNSSQGALTLPETATSQGTCLHSHLHHVLLSLSQVLQFWVLLLCQGQDD